MITTPVDTFVLASADGGTAWGALWAFFQEWPAMWPDLWLGTQDTLYMVWWATFFGVLFGLPLGVLLVVTGKGFRDGTGVLRSAVPRWLDDPPLRNLVLSAVPARPGDGGAGALYVLVRRRRP